MNFEEFKTKLLLYDLIIGKRKEIPHDYVIGIPTNKKVESMFEIYCISDEFVHHEKDFTPVLKYVLALINLKETEVI